MSNFASNTSVPIERSKTEIERTLLRYGVEQFAYGIHTTRGSGIAFVYKDRHIKLNIPLPKRDKFPSNRAGENKWQREHRRLWRVLLLWLKANLELIDCGLISFEDVFLAQTCLPSGQTFSEAIQPQIEKMITDGEMPKLLMSGGER